MNRSMIKLIIVIVPLILTGLLFIPFSPRMPTHGLDPSWRTALNVSVEQGYVFGRDLVFTFGPLGSVYTAEYSPATDLMMMVASIFYAFGLLIAIYLSAPPRRQWWAIVLPAVTSLFVMRDVVFLAMPFFLLLAVLRTTQPVGTKSRLCLTPSVVMGLVVASTALAIGPLVKTGFTGVVLPVGGLIFLVLLLASRWAAFLFAALVLGAMCCGWVLSGQALADLPAFFITQVPIISGYTNAMSLGGGASAVAYFLCGSVVVVLALGSALLREFGLKGWIACLGMMATLFVGFKAGFVRQDAHVFTSLGVLLLLAYAASLYARAVVIVVVWGATALVWLSVVSSVHNYQEIISVDKVARAWINSFRGIGNRLSQSDQLVAAYGRALEKIQYKYPLPKVQGTVDIYPVDLSAVFANRLNWSGRPVAQSYAVYDPALNTRNVAHLRSLRAPDTIFFSFAPIDDRLAALDDSGSVLELLAGYVVSDAQPPYVILKRDSENRKAELDVATQIKLRKTFGETITLDDVHPLWMQLDIKPTLLGRAVSALFRLPQVQIEITLENGRSFRKRVIPKMAETVFIVSPYLASGSDFVSLAAGLDNGSKVKSVKLYTEGTAYWQSSFDVHLTRVKLRPQESAKSLILSKPESAPVSVLAKPEMRQPAICKIDTLNYKPYQPGMVTPNADGTMQLEGWVAPEKGDDAGATRVWSIVEGPDGSISYYRAKVVRRPDVAAHFKRIGLIDAGFSITMDFTKKPGVNRISLISLAGDSVFTCSGLDVLVSNR